VVEIGPPTGLDGAMKTASAVAASVLVAAGLLSGCSGSVSIGGDTSASPTQATPDATTGVELTETLSNSEFGFSFGYSPPFEERDDASFSNEGGATTSQTFAVFDTEGSQIAGQYRDAFVVNVYPLQVEITEADLPAAKQELEQNVIPQLKASSPGMKIAPLTDSTLGGKPAFYTETTFDVEGKPIKSEMYFVFDGATEYQVLAQSAEQNWEQLKPTFDAMFSSFTLTGASASPSS